MSNNRLGTPKGTTDFIVPSIGVAHEMTQLAIQKDDYVTLRKIYQYISSDNTIWGNADDYHNLATEYAKIDDYLPAYKIVEHGLQQYPFNIDLLADGVYYGSNCQEYDNCEKFIKILADRPSGTWNWRAFTFTINYYKNKPDWTEDSTIILDSYHAALAYAKICQQVLPKEEKGYLAESEIHLLLENYYRGNDKEKKSSQADEEHEAALSILLSAIKQETFCAVQCCLKYADLLFEERQYENVISICDQALQYGEAQPSARLGYFVYLSAQSKDVLIHKNKAYNDFDKIKDVMQDYDAAYRSMDVMTYCNNIKNRATILSAKSGFPLPDSLTTKEPEAND